MDDDISQPIAIELAFRKSTAPTPDPNKSVLFVSKMSDPVHGGLSGSMRVREIAQLKDDVVNKRMDVLEPDCSFRYHNTYTCYKQYTDWRKLPSCSNLQIDEDVSVSIDNEDVDVLSHFVHNSSTRSANIPRPGPSTNIDPMYIDCVI